MGIMISPEKLRCFPLFAGLTDAVLKAVAMAGEEIALSKGTWLFYEGNEAYALYVILEGKIRLKIALDQERAYHADLDTLGEGDVIGWSALVEPYTYTLSAVAMTDVRLARLDGVSLCEIMARNTGAGYLFMSRLTQIIAGRLATIHARFASLVEGERWQRVAARKAVN